MVALEVEWQHDLDIIISAPELWPSDMPRLTALIDHWGPRLGEFEPCLDCPPCLARAEAEEADIEAGLTALAIAPVNAGTRARDDASVSEAKRLRDANLRRVFGAR